MHAKSTQHVHTIPCYAHPPTSILQVLESHVLLAELRLLETLTHSPAALTRMGSSNGGSNWKKLSELTFSVVSSTLSQYIMACKCTGRSQASLLPMTNSP